MDKKKAIIFETKKDKKKDKPDETIQASVQKTVKKPYSPKYVVKAEGDDAVNYDFVAHRPHKHKAGLSEALTHLVSKALGVTVYCLCDIYASNGLMGSAIIHMVLGIIMCYSSYSLTRSAHKVYGITNVPQMTYPDLAQAAMDISSHPKLRQFGGKFKDVVVAVVVANLIGKCCINQLILGNLLSNVYYTTKNLNIRKTVAVVMVPLFLICMCRSIENITPFMFGTYFFSILTSGFILGLGSWHIYILPLQEFLFIMFEDTLSFFQAFGGCAFAIDITTSVLTVENSMEAPRKIYKALIAGMSITGVLSIAMNAVSGYLSIKHRLNVDFIFLGFHPDSWFIGLFTFSICHVAFISFAVDFHIFFNLLWVYIKKYHSKENYWITERLYRAGFIVVITIFGEIFPSIAFFVSFFGSLSSIVSNFIILPIIEFLVDTRTMGFGKYNWKVVRLMAFIVPGVIMVIGGVITSLLRRILP